MAVAGAGGVTFTVAGGGGTIRGGALDDDVDVDFVTVALALRADDSALAARARLGATAAVLSRLFAAEA